MTQTFHLNLTTTALTLPNSALSGRKNNFSINIPNVSFPDFQKYVVFVSDFRYPTVDLSDEYANRLYSSNYSLLTAAQKIVVDRWTGSVVPLVQLSIAKPIYNNGSLGNLVYKGLSGSSLVDSSVYHVDKVDPHDRLYIDLAKNLINVIEFQILRSDTGTVYPFTDDEFEPPVSITIGIEAVVSPLINKALIPLNEK